LIVLIVLLVGAGPASATPAKHGAKAEAAMATAGDRDHGRDDPTREQPEKADHRSGRDRRPAGHQPRFRTSALGADSPPPAKRSARSKANPAVTAPVGVTANPVDVAATTAPAAVPPVATGVAPPPSALPLLAFGATFGVIAGPLGAVSSPRQTPPPVTSPVRSQPDWSLSPAMAFLAPLSSGVLVAGLQTATRRSMPVALAGIILLLLIVQAQIDRRDPKVALAPTHRGDGSLTFK
jgi:hypothetical protein